MMGLARVEVNLRRLLAKCELMVKNDQKDDDKLVKYIESVEDMLQEVSSTTPNNESVFQYNKRILSLKTQLGLIKPDEFQDKKLNEREELLNLRQRSVQKPDKNLDEIINYHQNMQEKIADDMLLLTRNLKEQSQLANKIIKKDTEVVGRSTQLSEQNYTKLKVESDKLAEHSKRAWKCWMWIMLVIVMVVFINMVFFMKVMKKRQQ